MGSTKLYDYAEQVGLDVEILKQCMESERGKEIVDAEIAEGLEFGIIATPVLFFNGHFAAGALSPKQLQLILDQYLPKTNEPEK